MLNVNKQSNQRADTDWMKKKQKQDPTICCLHETQFRLKNTNKLRVKVEEKI